MKNVTLLESIDDFNDFESFLRENNLNISEFEVVALDYKLQVYLKKRGMKYESTLKYFDNQSQKEILLGIDKMSRDLKALYDFTDSNGVRKVYIREIQLYLDLLFNYCAKILAILENVYGDNSDTEIFISDYEFYDNSPLVSNDHILVKLVQSFAKKRNIKFTTFRRTQKTNKSIRPFKKQSKLYSTFFTMLKNYLKFFKKEIILLSAQSSGFGKIIKEIKSKHKNAVFIIPYVNKENRKLIKLKELLYGFYSGIFKIEIGNIYYYDIDLDKENDDLLNSAANLNLDFFTFKDVSIQEIAKNKFAKGINSHLSSILKCSFNLNKLFEELNITVVISSFGTGLWYLMPEISKKNNIPAIFLSHGTHPAPTNRFHDISIFNMCHGFMLGEYSHIALSTPVQERHLHYYKNKYDWITNEEIKTGPLIFSKVSDKPRAEMRYKYNIKENDFVIVHATSIKWKGAERFYFLETIDEYLSALSDIVLIADNNSYYNLIIRIHPGFDDFKKVQQILLPKSKNYIINDTGSFSELLSIANLLVSYSSTCIDEALLNGVPVLLYDKWGRYNHFNTGIFQDNKSENIFPVCYVNDEKKLADAIKFMKEKVESNAMSKVDLGDYKYKEDYSKNFYDFIENAIKDRG